MNPHIFRRYDVRGIAGIDLTPSVACSIGLAAAAELRDRLGRRPIVVLGRDVRLSSPELAAALGDGLKRGGACVFEIGEAPTPVTYWAEHALEADGSIQITGSHNPPEWNGIKTTMLRAAIHGEAIQKIRSRIEKNDLPAVAGGEIIEVAGVLDRYIQEVSLGIRLERPVRVVVDCGNGAAGLVAQRLLTAIGADVIGLFCEPDGTFPNHHPDPTVDETLDDLIATVRRTGAEVGIAFDGDGDRIGAVDANGRIVRGDTLLALFAQDVLRSYPGAAIIFDVKCSQALVEVVSAAGGVPVMWKTGHSLIKEKMRELGSPLAGELSGHICFADRHIGTDDATYDACRLLELLSRGEESLAERVDRLPSFHSTPEIRIESDDVNKFATVAAAHAHFSATHTVVAVDGARIQFDGGWALLRASNTEPIIVARFEADTAARLEAIEATVRAWLATHSGAA
jgi:phosphomannomutase / phosphoglucomutase